MHALLLALGCAGLVCAVLCLGAVDDGAIVRGRVCFCRDLSDNSLSGTIPSQFGLLTAMTGQMCARWCSLITLQGRWPGSGGGGLGVPGR